MIKIPFTFLPVNTLKRISENTRGLSERLKPLFPNLKLDLKHSSAGVSEGDYIGMCLASSLFLFVVLAVLLSMLFSKLGLANFIIVSLIVSFLLALFAFFQQINYPRLIVARRVREIERNLMAALQNILVQMNSGVPLFDTLSNVAASNYGEVSSEFKNAIKKITAGYDEVQALEELATSNPSVFFRRSIWQLVNGMKAGGRINKVLEDVIKTLSEEQITSIQKYGSQLNPLAMFYMLIAVILPALGITFIIVLSSFISLEGNLTKLVFYGLFGIVTFFQIMFMGVIKARRPSLMSI